MRLKQVLIYAKNLPTMEAYYSSVLAQAPIEGTRSEGWVEYEAGIGLHAIPSHIADQITITQPPEPREETPIKIIFEVDNLEAEQSRLENLGIVFTHRPWGALDLTDPEGNIFQICPRVRYDKVSP